MAETNIIRAQKGFQEHFCRTNVDFCVGGGILNAGKRNPLSTNVLTPSGWVKMGDLKVGDLVSTPFGKPAPVTHIFEHEEDDIYRVTTSDGRSAECGYEHLWTIRTKKQEQKFHKERNPYKYLTVLETKDLIKRLEQGKKSYIQIPYAQQLPKKELVIPPYVMGVMLGDGCMTPSSWKQGTHIVISTDEEDILQKVFSLVGGERVYGHKSCYSKKIYTPKGEIYRQYCEKNNLLTYSRNKYIPEEYLNSDIDDRKALLEGLMDTDGSISVDGSFSFSTTSERIKDGFVYLCRSLGYQAKVKIDIRDKYKSGVGYNIRVLTFDKIFSSKKHTDKYKKWLEKERKYEKRGEHVYITSIEKTRRERSRCIVIDDPLHLYIIDDFLPTHNSFAAVLAIAEASTDKNFRALFLRNNLGDAKAGGGIVDTFKEVYGNHIKAVESGDPHIDFPSGARVDITHTANQSTQTIMQRFKGRQYDVIVFDEGTGFSWDTFKNIYTRNRGKGKWTGHVLMTTNPERDHWLRRFLDWYIGVDGFIRADRNGIVRYFYINGETVEDVVWGNSKREVYELCHVNINRKLKKMNGAKGDYFKWEDLIQSFTFYLGSMSENKASIGRNQGYAGAVAMAGGRMAEQLLEGNWNVSTKGELDVPIKTADAEFVFDNDPQVNGDRWITADLADYGTDNFVALVWDGFHILDILVVGKSTPRENADNLVLLADKYSIPDNHIIFDAIGGSYMKDYLPDAIPYLSYRQPIGVYGRGVMKLKDECFLRLVDVINRRMFSIDEKVAKSIYHHANVQETMTVRDEFLDECSVVRFRESVGGKKALFTKKEMKLLLGKHRSMDLLDPCAMRMFPVLQYNNGEELIKTGAATENEDDGLQDSRTVNVYEESIWY